MKKQYTFEVHTYAPELNKIYINGALLPLPKNNATYNLLHSLSKNYKSNLQKLRKYQKQGDTLNRHMFTFTIKNTHEDYIPYNQKTTFNLPSVENKKILDHIRQKNKVNTGSFRLISGKDKKNNFTYKQIENTQTTIISMKHTKKQLKIF